MPPSSFSIKGRDSEMDYLKILLYLQLNPLHTMNSTKRNLYNILFLFVLLIAWGITYINYSNQPTTNTTETPKKTIKDTIISDFNPIPTASANDSSIVNFSSEMDKQSVEKNIEIYPEIETNFIWRKWQNTEIQLKNKPEKNTDFISITC